MARSAVNQLSFFDSQIVNSMPQPPRTLKEIEELMKKNPLQTSVLTTSEMSDFFQYATRFEFNGVRKIVAMKEFVDWTVFVDMSDERTGLTMEEAIKLGKKLSEEE